MDAILEIEEFKSFARESLQGKLNERDELRKYVLPQSTIDLFLTEMTVEKLKSVVESYLAILSIKRIETDLYNLNHYLNTEKKIFNGWDTKVRHAKNVNLQNVVSTLLGVDNFRKRIRCPFHNDTHPDLAVGENRYKCFACGAGGDVINFIQNYHKVDFKEAINILQSF